VGYGVIFNIQRYTLHDGPGLRTELFLKGCPLRCKWCSNPEGWEMLIQPGVYKSKCIGIAKCNLCDANCPVNNMFGISGGKVSSFDKERCRNCMECAKACPSEAIKQWGKNMSIDECMEVIRKDKGFYDKSGGGVTVSGGEPLMQSDFVRDFFHACKEEKIHTCCETTLHADWKNIEKILPYTDLIITDIKHMDEQIHKSYTGVSNKLILKNMKMLIDNNKDVILRIPIIPRVNDDMDNIEKTADFILKELKGIIRVLQLLSFMRLGEEKYQSLGIPYPMKGVRVNRKVFQQKVSNLANYLNSRGIHCVVGTKEKV